MISEPYLSSEDSALLRSVLADYSGKVCLEIGAGNGGGLVELSRSFGHAVGTDLHPPSGDSWRGGAADYVLADAAAPFRQGAFDLVAFNPPYVPSENLVDEAVDGGANGIEVASRFLIEAIRVVRHDGRIVMLLSSDNPIQSIRSLCESRGFSMELIGTRHLFYESLSVYRISRIEYAQNLPSGLPRKALAPVFTRGNQALDAGSDTLVTEKLARRDYQANGQTTGT